MRKNYYDADALERVVHAFEEAYGLTSAEFYEALGSGSPPEGVPGFHRFVWASFYRDLRRLRGDDFAENAERLLTHAHA